MIDVEFIKKIVLIRRMPATGRKYRQAYIPGDRDILPDDIADALIVDGYAKKKKRSKYGKRPLTNKKRK